MQCELNSTETKCRRDFKSWGRVDPGPHTFANWRYPKESKLSCILPERR